MKSRVGLAISIGLNLGLVGAFAWLWFHPPQQRPGRGGVEVFLDRGSNGDGNGKEIQLAYPSRPDFKFPTNLLSHVTWRSIESPDYRRYIENLRAIKCPEKTIEEIIIADIDDLFAGRLRGVLEADADDFKYWQSGDGLPGFASDEVDLQTDQLDKERRDLIEELLGVVVSDSVVELAGIKPMELTLNFVPEERRSLVVAAQEQFAREQSALISSIEDVAQLESQLQELRDSYDQQLDELLTPEERMRFEMTTSPLAMALRLELTGFEPTEEEFRQIYEARKQREEDIQVAQAVVALKAEIELEDQRRMETERQQEVAMQAELLDRLGSERYAEYQRTLDPTYQTLIRSSIVNLVRPQTANEIYQLQQIAIVETAKVRANTEFTLDQQESALLGIQAETERTIRERYGANGLRAFQTWQAESSQ